MFGWFLYSYLWFRTGVLFVGLPVWLHDSPWYPACLSVSCLSCHGRGEHITRNSYSLCMQKVPDFVLYFLSTTVYLNSISHLAFTSRSSQRSLESLVFCSTDVMSPVGSPNSPRTRACHLDIDLFPFPFNNHFPIISHLLVSTTCSSSDCQVLLAVTFYL